MVETEKKSEEKKVEDMPVQAPKTETSENLAAQPLPQASDFLSAQEARATGESYAPTPEEIKQRNKRSLVMALGILAFMVLVYAITVLKIGATAG